eukprot:01879_6
MCLFRNQARYRDASNNFHKHFPLVDHEFDEMEGPFVVLISLVWLPFSGHVFPGIHTINHPVHQLLHVYEKTRVGDPMLQYCTSLAMLCPNCLSVWNSVS